jgi:phosphotransferase system IIB component
VKETKKVKEKSFSKATGLKGMFEKKGSSWTQ